MTGPSCSLPLFEQKVSITQGPPRLTPIIPPQIQRTDLLFVVIPSGEKGPRTPGWNLVSNGMKWNDIRLISHIQNGGNYGFFPAPGSNLISFDIDDADAFHEAGGKDLVENTFCYSAWITHEKYRALVSCPDLPEHFRGHKVSIKETNQKTILELFFPADDVKSGGQVVGPGSLHPNGNRYSPFDGNIGIKMIYWESIEQVASRLKGPTWSDPIPNIQSKPIHFGHSSLIRDKYRISVMDHVPLNSYLSGQGIRGEHPVHGSTSKGGNVVINPLNEVFYCFRCQRGGDATIWDAICRGIIRCDEEYDNDALKRHLKILDFEKPEVKYLDQIAWKKNQLSWRRL